MPMLEPLNQFPVNSKGKINASKWMRCENGEEIVVFSTTKRRLFTASSDGIRQTIKPPKHAERLGGSAALEISPDGRYILTTIDSSRRPAILSVPSLNVKCEGPIEEDDGAVDDHDEEGLALQDLEWLDNSTFASCNAIGENKIWQLNHDNTSMEVRETSLSRPSFLRLLKKSGSHLLALTSLSRLQIRDTGNLNVLREVEVERWYQNSRFCLEVGAGLVGVGHNGGATFYDPSDLGIVNNLASPYPGCGFTTLSIEDDIITVGTTKKEVYFVDRRTFRYLDAPNRQNAVQYTNEAEIGTHSYSASGKTLFIGGELVATFCTRS